VRLRQGLFTKALADESLAKKKGFLPFLGHLFSMATFHSPRHFQARAVVKSGIFEELASFRELERRIVSLSTPGDRGEAFEVFAEAYLVIVASQHPKQIYPEKSIPYSLRNRLVLTGGDNGVDGIFETELGEFHAYQVKFRSGRPDLNWTELSTFIGLADRVQNKLVFTNANDFADAVKQRTGFYAITGNDLDNLTGQDFNVIRAWFDGTTIALSRKAPLPHQAEALNTILPALKMQ
jgi:predicted helicase